jgi:hypothetical protein
MTVHISKKVVVPGGIQRTVSRSMLCLLRIDTKYHGFLTEFGKFAMGKKEKEKKKGKGAAKTAEKTEKKQKTKVKKELAAKGKNCEFNINISTNSLASRLLRMDAAAFLS